MISYSEALSILTETGLARQGAFLAQSEKLPLEACTLRIATEEVRSREAVPPFDNSAMDGFAVRASRTANASPAHPVRLPVVGSTAAGDPMPAGGEGAWEIVTGAPLAPGCGDTIVKVEDVTVLRDPRGRAKEIILEAPVRQGEFIRHAAEDFAPGQIALRPGTRLLPDHLMALASLGVSSLHVARRPRVAFIPTGRELVHFREPLPRPGLIRNSTAPYLMSAIPLHGAEPLPCATVADDPGAFQKLVKNLLEAPDCPEILLTTGAVSKGTHDFIPDSLRALGARVHFHHVAIRPGKPILFGEFEGGPVVFGIPGNPISTAVGLRFFIGRYLEALTRSPRELPARAVLADASVKPQGLRCFMKARVDQTEGGDSVSCLPGQPSFMVSSLLEANAWAVLPETEALAEAGTECEIYPIHPTPGGIGWEMATPNFNSPTQLGDCCA